MLRAAEAVGKASRLKTDIQHGEMLSTNRHEGKVFHFIRIHIFKRINSARRYLKILSQLRSHHAAAEHLAVELFVEVPDVRGVIIMGVGQ